MSHFCLLNQKMFKLNNNVLFYLENGAYGIDT